MHYALGFLDVIKTDIFHKITWLKELHKVLGIMGMQGLWENPETAQFPTKGAIKERYWEMVAYGNWNDVDPSTMDCRFLETKVSPSLEPYWDNITKPEDRKLYFQLRAGSLPIRSLTGRWGIGNSELCPACKSESETIAHLLFVCRAYLTPQRVWLKAMCKLLGTRDSKVALRIISTNTLPVITVAVAKYLGWAWAIRRKLVVGLTPSK